MQQVIVEKHRRAFLWLYWADHIFISTTISFTIFIIHHYTTLLASKHARFTAVRAVIQVNEQSIKRSRVQINNGRSINVWHKVPTRAIPTKKQITRQRTGLSLTLQITLIQFIGIRHICIKTLWLQVNYRWNAFVQLTRKIWEICFDGVYNTNCVDVFYILVFLLLYVIHTMLLLMPECVAHFLTRVTYGITLRMRQKILYNNAVYTICNCMLKCMRRLRESV